MAATAVELSRISTAWRRADPLPLALATLVEVEGSSYRRPGAKLLIHADGSTVGNLTGGCLDQEIVEAAQTTHQTGTAQVVGYDLRGEDEAILGWGMGCNGVLRVLVEPAGPENSMLQVLEAAVRLRRPVRILTVISGPPGTIGHRWWQVDGDEPGSTIAVPVPAPVPVPVPPSIHAVLADRTDGVVTVADGSTELRVFAESLLPTPRLVVCGAGDDVPPVIRAATALGWEAVVVDHRRHLLDPDRFPAGTRLLRADPAQDPGLDIDGFSCVVVMTHNFLQDCAYLAAALKTPARYVGVLGPERRLQRMRDFLAADGIHPTASDEARLRGPAGLDLGGQGPDEIAVEIIAEVLAATRRPTANQTTGARVPRRTPSTAYAS
ncbi:XdhC family protein [Kribbella sancticallisti]|uniref:XdhC family protein n=1 Tax=Kribbella sancticallisti TaxID=460087 RepID=A0ABP4QSX2_9ACTN